MSKILNVETRVEPVRARPAPMEPPGQLDEVHAKLDRLTADLVELRREIRHFRQVDREPPSASRAGSSALSRVLRLGGWSLALLCALVVWMTDPAAPPAIARGVRHVAAALLSLPTGTPPRVRSTPAGPVPASAPSASPLPAADAAPVSSGENVEESVAL